MTVSGYGCTHVGRRDNNEDSLLVDDDVGLYIVADGMGGYEGGEIASRLVVRTLESFFHRADPTDDDDFTWVGRAGETVAEARLALALRQANREVQKRRLGKLASMGSTVVALVVGKARALVAHVGDSRAYRMRGGQLVALTKDHSLFMELVDAGIGPSRAGVHRNTITRAVGVPGSSRPDFSIIEIEPGDRFLLCSDGLTDVLGEDEIEASVARIPPERTAETLVARAYLRGGEDNITAVVVEAH